MSLLGVEVDLFTIQTANDLLVHAIDQAERVTIGYHNLHSAYLYHRDEPLREFYAAADYSLIDGMPLVWVGRLLGHTVARDHRVCYLDWIDPLMACAAAHGWKIFFLGGRPGVAPKAAEILEAKYPGIEMQHRHGYFDATPGSTENSEILRAISKVEPDILMVGMGMPRQEHWVLENRSRIEATVPLTTGAIMDYVAGAVPTTPRWLGPLGLEWLFRLAVEPRRLAKRYLVEPWFLMPLFLRDLRRSQTGD